MVSQLGHWGDEWREICCLFLCRLPLPQHEHSRGGDAQLCRRYGYCYCHLRYCRPLLVTYELVVAAENIGSRRRFRGVIKDASFFFLVLFVLSPHSIRGLIGCHALSAGSGAAADVTAVAVCLSDGDNDEVAIRPLPRWTRSTRSRHSDELTAANGLSRGSLLVYYYIGGWTQLASVGPRSRHM